MSKKWARAKDPNEVLDYSVDWLGTATDPGELYSISDTIASSTWTVPAGITKDSSSFTDGDTTVWLSGGTAGETYSLLNRVVTDGGRTMDQTVLLKMKDR